MVNYIEVILPLPETLDDLLAAWARSGLAAGHSARTIESRAYTVKRLAKSVDPMTATRDDLVTWLSELTQRDGSGPATRSSRATYRSQLRSFYAWLEDEGRRADNPSATLPQPRVPRAQPRPLSPRDVQKVLDACSDRRAASTLAYVTLACFAGLRVHEIAKVRGEDMLGAELRVRGKGGSDYTVPLHPRVAALAATMPSVGWWFPGQDGGHVHRVSVGLAIKRAMGRAEVKGTPHACRHFYGTEVLRASGGNLRVAQRALRHADVRSTAIYTQVADDALRYAIGGIGLDEKRKKKGKKGKKRPDAA